MSIDSLITLLSQKREEILYFLCAVPLGAILLRLLHGKYKGKRSPWKYFYSVLVYIICIPGIFSLVISAYSLLFLHENLMTLDVLVYYLPVLSMIITLVIIKRSVEFEYIPGFSKIYGLMILFFLTFVIALILDKLRVFVIFGGSISSLFVVCVIIFLLLKYSIKLLFGSFGKKY